MRWWPLQGWARSPPAAPGSIGYKGGGHAGVTAGRRSFLLHIDSSVKKLEGGWGVGWGWKESNDQSQRATFSHGARVQLLRLSKWKRWWSLWNKCSAQRPLWHVCWRDSQMTRHLFESTWNSQVGRVQRSSMQWGSEWTLANFLQIMKKTECLVKATIAPRLRICLTCNNQHWLESTE